MVAAGANGRVGDEALDAVALGRAGDVLLAQLEVPLTRSPGACAAASGAARGSCSTSRRTPTCPPTWSRLADPVIVNEHEAAPLADTDAGPPSLLVTFGAAGADWDGLRVPAVGVGGRGRRHDRGR